jgi:hypothetical protein
MTKFPSHATLYPFNPPLLVQNVPYTKFLRPAHPSYGGDVNLAIKYLALGNLALDDFRWNFLAQLDGLVI